MFKLHFAETQESPRKKEFEQNCGLLFADRFARVKLSLNRPFTHTF